MSLEFSKVDLSGLNKAMEDVNNSIKKIAEDIRKRKDNAMAMEFTRVICDLLKENGVTVQMTEIEEENHATNKFEVNYGVRFTGIDFSEHDKKVAEEKDAKIADLEHMRKAWMETAAKWAEKNEVLKSQIKDLKDIVENEKLAELEDRHQSDCIEINRLHTALEVMTEKYMKLREVHGL